MIARRLAPALLLAAAASPALALSPDDIAILYNEKSPDSLKVAEFYMHARNIPASHLVAIRCDPQESIPENIYRLEIVPALRHTLADRKLDTRIKCLVTTYDVPLTIGPVIPGPGQAQIAAKLQDQLKSTTAEIAQAEAAYNAIAAGPATPSAPAAATLAETVARLNAAIAAAVKRIADLPEPQRQPALQKLAAVQERVAGLTGVLSLFHVKADAPDNDEGRRQLNRLTQQLRDAEAQYADLKKRDLPAAREGMVDLKKKMQGLIGQAQELDLQINALAPPESESCFDNELALVLAADQSYPRARWILNPCNLELWPSVKKMADVPHTLMVCRIDGPTPAAAMDLVNRALKTEKTGLDGKLYLDARGLTGTDAYSAFDADLRSAYAWLNQHADIPVVLDDRPELLDAKNCPDAALYCGWYSLHNYHDSVQWLPGAVGYHVASLEMPTLRKPDDTGWVPQMLHHGVAGTLGAVSEPYLASFPKPSQFFPLLLSGEFTQGEVWQVTNPWLSWRQGFVGDPLYNPFKLHPRVPPAALKESTLLKNAYEILR